MSVEDIRKALDHEDDALIRHFLTVWPVVASILEAFSNATKLPIFVYLGEVKVFQSSRETMPPFCRAMLDSPIMEAACTHDGLRRAKKLEPDVTESIQCCHAGMINGRREIDTRCVGMLSILFGSKKSLEETAVLRRRAIIQIARRSDPDLAGELEQADDSDRKAGLIDHSDAVLMDAISNIIQQLLSATVGFRSLTINMAHELSLTMLGLGLLAKEMEYVVEEAYDLTNLSSLISEIRNNYKHILNESRLGLHIVRNFLSHTSESRYIEIVRPKFEEVNLANLLIDMIDLHKMHAEDKHISFDLTGVDSLPKFHGSDMEIRRLFHNILSNAIKYSYHSISETQRTIRIGTKIPYDPGFRKRRFSITFENYGLGLSEEEKPNVLKPGFRGKQAIAEVPIGAGIGLSEVAKIMRAHDGEIKFRSKKLHDNESGENTYLTRVDLIFPYLDRA